MSSAVDAFSSKVFNYIRNEYGSATLKKVQLKKNNNVVSKVLESALRQEDTIDHAGNKVIAMLRLN